MGKKFKDLVEECGVLLFEDTMSDFQRHPSRKIGDRDVVSFWLNDDVKLFVELENSLATFIKNKLWPQRGSMSPEQQSQLDSLIANIQEYEKLARR